MYSVMIQRTNANNLLINGFWFKTLYTINETIRRDALLENVTVVSLCLYSRLRFIVLSTN